ncbi:LIPR2-like protein [Mya arenaria]|uniref:LIPR2-like protein n=1 Tax=Mya arenaria TaxID=6604 RepID=A0ABY7FXX4_MYAAR|nr:LIPR2-like protein [Mya arenaria]
MCYYSTGLDPAGPAFTKSDAIVRLDPTDAVYVDAIHSDGAPLQDAGFGTILSMGHKDFYPNGGQVQPGCPAPISTTVEQLLTGQICPERQLPVYCTPMRLLGDIQGRKLRVMRWSPLPSHGN